MQKEGAIIAGLCLAVATVTVLYLVFFGLPAPSAGGGNQSAGTKLSYDIGGCGTQEETDYAPSRGPAGGIIMGVSGDMLVLAHNLTYVCCAKMNLQMETREEDGRKLVVLTETNTGQMCRCICGYTVNANVGPLSPGSYDVQLWGVAFGDTEPELMLEKEVEIG